MFAFRPGQRPVGVLTATRAAEVDQGALIGADPQADAEVEVIPLGGDLAGDVEIGHGSIWVSFLDTNDKSRVLLRLDPNTGEVVARIPLHPEAGLEDILLGEGSVWIPEYGVEGATETVVTRIDPRTNAVTGRVDLGASAELAVFDGDLWGADGEGVPAGRPRERHGGPEPVPVDGDPVGGETGTRKSSEVAWSNVAPGGGRAVVRAARTSDVEPAFGERRPTPREASTTPSDPLGPLCL